MMINVPAVEEGVTGEVQGKKLKGHFLVRF